MGCSPEPLSRQAILGGAELRSFKVDESSGVQVSHSFEKRWIFDASATGGLRVYLQAKFHAGAVIPDILVHARVLLQPTVLRGRVHKVENCPGIQCFEPCCSSSSRFFRRTKSLFVARRIMNDMNGAIREENPEGCPRFLNVIRVEDSLVASHV